MVTMNPYAAAAVAQYLNMLPPQQESAALLQALQIRQALQGQRAAYEAQQLATAKAMMIPELATPKETIMETPLRMSPTELPMPNALMQRIMQRRAMDSGLPAQIMLQRNLILNAERIRMLESARLVDLLRNQNVSPDMMMAVLSGAQTVPLDVGRSASQVLEGPPVQ